MDDFRISGEQDRQPTVLIVDDISENIQVLGTILDEHGIEFSYASSGTEALESVSFSKPDLILLDVSMPGMTGYEVCEILKKNGETKEIPVIFLTAKTETTDIIKGLDVGGIDYVTKPFNSKELLTRVKMHLELSLSKKIISKQNAHLEMINKQLREALAAKDKFFSIVAHDLKSPFHTLLGFSDLLLTTFENRDPEDIKRQLKIIKQSSQNAYELLINLLEWSRSQTGRLKHKPVVIDLAVQIKEVMSMLSNTAERKQIQLILDIQGTWKGFEDKHMFQTVIRNLVSNALKFTRPGGRLGIRGRELENFTEIIYSPQT
ncbi:MAG: hybrid sensor histidine kinase/response regulator [Bacteroidales bacterium]|nr:hybrid sensor histidine kinase/response regulator [Bacteroidales bacterium]